MSFFTNLFGKKNTVETNINSGLNGATETTTDNNINVMEDLFVENTAPIQDEMTAETGHISISTFLDRDFRGKGINDGYSSHSGDMLDLKVKTIKSEFRLLLDQKMDELNQQKLKFADHKIEVSGLSERMSQQIQLRLEFLDLNMTRLEKEKELSSQDEGMVMQAINQYREGFLTGMESYQEEKLLAGSTGLFI